MLSNLKHKKRVLAGALGILFVLLLIFAPLQGSVPIVHAQLEPAAAVGGGAAAQSVNQTPVSAGGNGTQAPAGPADPPLCTTASSCIGIIVYVFTVPIMSVFAYVGDWVFSLAVQLSLNSNAYSLDFLTSAWAVVRDLANMSFIFILVYLAITIMFSAENPNTMKTLAATIIMALLINFSFFITRVVIDAGNILAIQFYNAIPCNPGAPCTLGQTSSGSSLLGGTAGSSAGTSATTALNYITGVNGQNAKDLTTTIMQSLGAQNLLGTVSLSVANQKDTGPTQFAANLITIIIIYISTAAIFAMLAFAFLTVGFKFVMRIVVLWFIIIAAPAAFAIRSLSASTRKAHEWWGQWCDALIKFSFYPAIFLFMFMLMNVVMRALGQCPTNTPAGFNGPNSCGLIPNIFAGLQNQGAGIVGGANTAGSSLITIGSAIANVGLRLGIVLIMLYYGLKVADMIVHQGTGAARAVSNWAGRKAGAATFGTASFAARQTIGRGANAASRSNFVQNSLRGLPLVGTATSDFTRRKLEGVASSRLDLRNAPGGSVLQRAGDLGKAGKGGYREGMENRKKKLETQAKALKPTDLEVQAAILNDEKRKDLIATRDSEKEDLLKQAEQWRQAQKEAIAGGDQMRAQRAAGLEGAAMNKIAQQQKDVEDREKAVKTELENAAKANMKKLADGLITARGYVGGNTLGRGAIYKLIGGKSKAEVLADAAHEDQKEHDAEHAAEHGDDHPPASPGGGGNASGGGGGSSDHGGSGGGHAQGGAGGGAHAQANMVVGDIDSKISDALNAQAAAIRELRQNQTPPIQDNHPQGMTKEQFEARRLQAATLAAQQRTAQATEANIKVTKEVGERMGDVAGALANMPDTGVRAAGQKLSGTVNPPIVQTHATPPPPPTIANNNKDHPKAA